MRFVTNIILKAAMILALNWFGLFTLMKDGHVATDTRELITVALGGALIFVGASVLLFLCTFGFAALLFVFYGWGVLVLMSHIAPGFIHLGNNFWITALAGFLIGIFQLPSASRR